MSVQSIFLLSHKEDLKKHKKENTAKKGLSEKIKENRRNCESKYII